MTSLTQQTETRERVAVRKLWWVTLAAAATATILNFVILFIAQGLLGETIVVQPPGAPAPQTISAALVPASVVPAIGAALLLLVLSRFTRRPFTIFAVLAGVVLLLSLGGPLTLPISGAQQGVLVLLHVVTAVIIGGIFWRFGREVA